MGPTMPITPSKKRGLKRLTILGLLLAAAVFYHFKRKLIGGGIDTPIVITGGSLKLYSATPFTYYKVDDDKKQISHPKEGNRVVHLKVLCNTSSTTTINLYDEPVDGKCDVIAVYTGDAGEDSVQVFTKSNGKGLKIKFKRKKFDEYIVLDDNTREHRDKDNMLKEIKIRNGSTVEDLTCLTGICKIEFTYED